MGVKNNKSKAAFIAAMIIFGSIGIFRRYIDLPSSVLAFARGVIGTLFLVIFVKATGKKPDKAAVRSNLALLIISGALIGFNWILLFESYNYTTVSVATLCYYMAPVFLILASPPVLKERLTVNKLIAVLAAVAGMSLVSGVFRGGEMAVDQRKGVLLGLGAALLYATVIIMNKKMGEIDSYSKTIVQLGSSAVCLLPYVLLTENVSEIRLDGMGLLMVVAVGIIHTGVAYALYFSSMKSLSAQNIAIFSYIDPVFAIILSAVILKEPMGFSEIIGAVLILGAAIYSEFTEG